MQDAKPNWLVFTDLDGTLLDKHSYSYLPALPAIQRLAEYQIPLIFNTSKTIPEVLRLRQELQNPHPFICENGGVLLLPDDYFPTLDTEALPSWDNGYRFELLGVAHDRLLEKLTHAAGLGFQFTGMSEMSSDALSAFCGLSLASAAEAKQRLCSEPIIWQGSESSLSAFRDWLAEQGLTLLRGGRFHHVMAPQSKGAALHRLSELYQQAHNKSFSTLALGDSENDISMLQQADMAVVIATEQGSMALPQHPNCQFPIEPGPVGWNRTVLEWHNHLQES